MLHPEELGRLHGDESDRAGRAEHEHAVVCPHRRTPSDRHPPGHARDAACCRYLVRHRFRQGNTEVGGCRRALREQSVARESEAVAEEVGTGAVGGAADALAARDVRELRVARKVASGSDVDVYRVQGHRRDLVDRLARRLRPVGQLGRRSERTDHRGSHGSDCRSEGRNSGVKREGQAQGALCVDTARILGCHATTRCSRRSHGSDARARG